MSQARSQHPMHKLLNELYPEIPRGKPHYLQRQKQRAAFIVGFERGFSRYKHYPFK